MENDKEALALILDALLDLNERLKNVEVALPELVRRLKVHADIDVLPEFTDVL